MNIVVVLVNLSKKPIFVQAINNSVVTYYKDKNCLSIWIKTRGVVWPVKQKAHAITINDTTSTFEDFTGTNIVQSLELIVSFSFQDFESVMHGRSLFFIVRK